MKRALISRIEVGRICEVVEQGKDFEVSPDFFWMNCPDDITTHDTIDMPTGKWVKFDPVKQPGFAESGYKVARAIAYKSVGEQLDMIYKEVAENGKVSPDGPWATHISNVKSAIPKDDPEAVMAWNRQFAEQQRLAQEGQPK
jgi:hypothetical protein